MKEKCLWSCALLLSIFSQGPKPILWFIIFSPQYHLHKLVGQIVSISFTSSEVCVSHTGGIRTSYFPPPAALVLGVVYPVYDWFHSDKSHTTQRAARRAALWMPSEPQLLCQPQEGCRPEKSFPRRVKNKQQNPNFPISLSWT